MAEKYENRVEVISINFRGKGEKKYKFRLPAKSTAEQLAPNVLIKQGSSWLQNGNEIIVKGKHKNGLIRGEIYIFYNQDIPIMKVQKDQSIDLEKLERDQRK